jgi:uncharacterized protein with HEPN domain
VTAARDHRDFPNDMVLACRSIIRFAEGVTLDGYLADERTRYAMMRLMRFWARRPGTCQSR